MGGRSVIKASQSVLDMSVDEIADLVVRNFKRITGLNPASVMSDDPDGPMFDANAVDMSADSIISYLEGKGLSRNIIDDALYVIDDKLSSMSGSDVMSSRADDIRRKRDEWDSRNKEQKSKHDVQYKEYTGKVNEILSDIRQQVVASLAEVKTNLEVNVRQGWSMDGQNIEVIVEGNQRDKHSPDKALSWDWRVTVDRQGNPQPATSSWSGLQATTPEQLESLRQTVRALEILNGIDWNYMLNVTLPDYSKLVTERESIGQRPSFESDLKSAELDDFVGTDILIQGTNRDGRGKVYYNIISETEKMYTVASLPGRVVDNPEDNGGKSLPEMLAQAKNWSERIKKTTVVELLKYPYQTVEV